MSDLAEQATKLLYLCRLNDVDSNVIAIVKTLETYFRLQNAYKAAEQPKSNRMVRATHGIERK